MFEYDLSWHTASFELCGSYPEHALSLYRGAAASWAMNPAKGSFGESVLSRGIVGGLLQEDRGPWAAITPHRSGAAGIDKLFIRLDKAGQPRSLMVAEAKFGSSRLGNTATGRQMSDSWIRPRLAATARDYSRAADALHGRVAIRAFVRGETALAVAVPRFGTVLVVAHDDVAQFHCRGGRPPIQLVEQQLRRTARLLGDAAVGRRSYRSRLFRLTVRGDSFELKLDVVGPDGNVTARSAQFAAPPRNLHGAQRNLLRQTLAATFREQGVVEDHVEVLSDKVLDSPELLSRMHLQPEASWRVGLDQGMARAGFGAALLAAVSAVIRAWRSSGTVDWKQVSKLTLLSGANAAVGYYVGAQIHVRLVTSEIGQRLMSSLPLRGSNGSVLLGYGGLGGAIVTSVFFAAGAYLLGLVDAREARIMGAAGVAGAAVGALFTSGAFGAAALFGTASTGTAIGSLSGAAFTNAALAWLGGVAAAAGGGGMALGGAILSGGVLVVGVLAGVGVRWGFQKLREIERRRLLVGRINLVRETLGVPGALPT
jgi:hypothetical protein